MYRFLHLYSAYYAKKNDLLSYKNAFDNRKMRLNKGQQGQGSKATFSRVSLPLLKTDSPEEGRRKEGLSSSFISQSALPPPPPPFLFLLFRLAHLLLFGAAADFALEEEEGREHSIV